MPNSLKVFEKKKRFLERKCGKFLCIQMVSHVSLTVATMYFQVNPLLSNFCMIINIYLIFLDKCVAFVVVLKKKRT